MKNEFVIYMCCIFMYKKRLCDGPILGSRSPTECPNNGRPWSALAPSAVKQNSTYYEVRHYSNYFAFSCVICGFRRDIDEICALLGYYTALSGSSVPTFRDKLSVPSLRVRKSKQNRLLDS
jgi:hypothetical protein